MKKYEDLSGRGGVTGYKNLLRGIILEYQHKDQYLYDYEKPGKNHVEQMKILAESGKGLTTYVNENVRDNYKEKVK